MRLITLLTDFGDTDHYVASVKAAIMKHLPMSQIVDISHKIQQFNLPHAAFVLNSVFREFPEGTIHLVSVNDQMQGGDIFIIAKIEGHFFVAMDNGILSLISDQEPEMVVRLNSQDSSSGTFPAKTLMVPAVIELCEGRSLSEIGQPAEGIRKMFNRHPRLTHNQIMGQVIHVDHYGNLITNINKSTFEKIGKNRKFTLSFSREKLSNLSVAYSEQDPGDCLAVFNINGELEIAINAGNASELLGLHYNSPVMVNFIGE